MSDTPSRRVALVAAASLAFLVGSLAWVFPKATTVSVGGWVLPVFAIASLGMAVGLAAGWPWLRGVLAVLAVLLVISWRPSSDTSTQHLAGASLGLLLMLLVATVADSEKRLRLAMVAFLAAGLLVLVVGFAGIDLNPLAFSDFVAARLPGVRLGLQGIGNRGVNPNALAAAALLIVPLGVSVLLSRPPRQVDRLVLQVPGLLVFACGTIILVISQSRSAWIAIWVTLVALLVRGPVSWVWRVLLGTAVVAAPMAAAVRVSLLDRDALLSQVSDFWGAAADRGHVMAAGLARWRESPWLGIGLNRFRDVYQPPPSIPAYDVAHSHNVLLQTGLDIGLLGLMAYCALLAFLLMRADRAARGPSPLGRTAAAGAGISLLAVHIFGLTDAVALGAKIGLFQWMASGLILSAWRLQCPDSIGRHPAVSP